MKRKLLCTILFLTLTLSGIFTACSSNADDSKKNDNDSAVEDAISSSHYILVNSTSAEGFRNSDDLFINNKGEQITLKTSWMDEVRNGICAYEDDNYEKLALRNVTTGEVIVSGYSTYKWLVSDMDSYKGVLADYIVIEKDDLYGIIDTDGNIVVDIKYKDFDVYGTEEYPYIRAELDNKEYEYFNKELVICDPEGSYYEPKIKVFSSDNSSFADVYSIYKDGTKYCNVETKNVLFEESNLMSNISIEEGIVFYTDTEGDSCFGILSDDCKTYIDMGKLSALNESFISADLGLTRNHIASTNGKRAFTLYDNKSKEDFLFIYTTEGELDASVPYCKELYAYNGRVYFTYDQNNKSNKSDFCLCYNDGVLATGEDFDVKKLKFDDEHIWGKYLSLTSAVYDLELGVIAYDNVIGADYSGIALKGGTKYFWTGDEFVETPNGLQYLDSLERYYIFTDTENEQTNRVITDKKLNEIGRIVLEEDMTIQIRESLRMVIAKDKYWDFEGNLLFSKDDIQ